MQPLEKNLFSLTLMCRDALAKVSPKGGRFGALSERTRHDYVKLAKSLLRRSNEGQGLRAVVLGTSRPSTFFKRLASLRYFLHLQHMELMAALQNLKSEAQGLALQEQLSLHLDQLLSLHEIQQSGLCSQRRKRKSKRQALKGLPIDWREQLCERGKAGKYAAALAVAAVSGCRPSELQRGIRVWRQYDESHGADLIYIEIEGSKVKENQGQPRRVITYSELNPHPLVCAVNRLLDEQDDASLFAKIDSAINFSVEVRRLANRLWPDHKESITAYCFRHQWSSDMKRAGNADAVSRGLGHASAKTRRSYGTAGQAKAGGGLRPLAINADRTVKPTTAAKFATLTQIHDQLP